MNGFFGRKVANSTRTQRAVSKLMVTSALVAVGTFGFVSSANAVDFFETPTNPVIAVGNGAATVSTSGFFNQNLNVNQSTDRVIIDWNTFNIGTGAKVQFYQPNSGSLAVNRVSNDGQFSSINGRLVANGKVMILDPNGVMFGAGSIVDVGAIIASTGNVDDARVMAGDLALQLTNFGTGEIVNNGLINAKDSGLVAFVGPTVKNNGIINAKLGKVSLAAGDLATVDLYGDGLVELGLTGNRSAKFLSENKGAINAVGGKIQMSAAAARNIVDSVVNMEGIANVNSVFVKDGKIVLSAGKVKVNKKAVVFGATEINADSADLGTTIIGDVTGDSKEVNILSNKAKIAQGLGAVGENGTVKVAAGTYNEHLVVDTKGVTLNGANSGIAANGVRGAETIIIPNSPGVTVTADNVTIDGMVFTGATGADGYGIFVDGGDYATLKNNIIYNVSQYGVYLLNSLGSVVSGNAIYNTGNHGIYALNSANTQILKNNIGTLGGNNNINGDGVLLETSNGSSVKGNTITETTSTASEIGSGVHVLNSDNVVVGTDSVKSDRNFISNTEWDGVKVKGGSGVKVTGNSLYNLSRSGVAADETDNTIISNNFIDNVILGVWSYFNSNIQIINNDVRNITSTPNSSGIQTYGDDRVLISGNIIDNTYLDGVYSKNSSNVTITGNTISNTGRAGAPAERGNGIRLDGGTNNVISNNDITATKWDGIKVVSSNGVQVINNNLHDLNRSGIGIDETDSAFLSENIIDNVILGIWSYRNSNIQIVDNSISNITTSVNSNGIQTYEDDGVLISANIIDNTYLDGVYSKNSSNVTITGNTISNTGRAGTPAERGNGIRLDGGTNNVISNNDITATKWDGIKVVDSDGVQIIANNVYDVNRSGIAVDGINSALVSKNIIDNAILGIWSYLNSNIQIIDNNVTNISGNGIQTYEDNGVLISGNTIQNTNNGIHAINVSGLIQINGNAIDNSGDNGIYVHNLDLFKSFIFFGGDEITLNISGNTITDSNIGVNLESINGDLNVTKNTITNSNYDGVYVENVNQGGGFYPYPTLFIEQDVVEQPSELPVRQLTIANNDIDNSGSNGIELNNVGGLVTIDSNHITNSGFNGVLAYNYSSPVISDEQGREGFYIQDYYYGSTPIELHIVNNIIENIGSGEGDGGNQEQKIANITPFGFAAVNVDVSGDGYVELSGNTLGNNFEYGLVAYSGTIDLTGATNTIQNTNIGMGFYPTDGTPESDSEEYFNYLASQLSLVNDTIGTTAFVDQSELFVDLGYGAMFAPGTPTQLDGNNATYTLGGVTIDPAANGGVTQAEYDVLESMINHYNDNQDRGQFFFNILPAFSAFSIDQKDVLRDLFVPFGDQNGGSLTITGLPSIGGPTGGAPAPTGTFDPNAIEPAAGDEEGAPTGDVAAVEPAAGGDANCWEDAAASLGQGTPVTFNFGAGSSALLQDAASCGNGGQAL